VHPFRLAEIHALLHILLDCGGEDLGVPILNGEEAKGHPEVVAPLWGDQTEREIYNIINQFYGS